MIPGSPCCGLAPITNDGVQDEALDADEPLTSVNVDMLMNESVFLLLPAERGGEFGERYMAALQRDPHVVLAHAQVSKRIGLRKPPA